MRPADEALKSDQEAPIQPTPVGATAGQTEVRVKGNAVSVPSAQIQGRTVITTGNWLRIAAVQDEELVEGDVVTDPEACVSHLRDSDLKADILTFAQKLPETAPKYAYHLEWDSLAMIPITTYSDWWEKRAKHDVQKAVKKAAKHGLIVRQAEFGDSLVEGIVGIYNESPLRQGKPFWHYGKSFDVVKQMSATYLDRSIFIGAFLGNELIGFIKMVRVGSGAFTLHVISMQKHSDKKPTNALIAKAVEICAERGMSHLVYGNFVYNDPKSSLTEFKRRNGFEEVLVPRYYIPLSVKGRIALSLKLHKGISGMLPHNLSRLLLRARTLVWKLRESRTT